MVTIQEVAERNLEAPEYDPEYPDVVYTALDPEHGRTVHLISTGVGWLFLVTIDNDPAPTCGLHKLYAGKPGTNPGRNPGEAARNYLAWISPKARANP